jgi:6-phosphogluconate dehydrogenase
MGQGKGDYGIMAVPVLTTAIDVPFSSRGEAAFRGKVLSALRFQFGGHLEKTAAR